MAFKLEREKDMYIDIDLNGEIFKIKVGGIEQLRNYMNYQEKVNELSKKCDKMGDNITQELIDLVGKTVVCLFQVVFGESLTDKIVAYYENNYDEMLVKVFPFIRDEWFPACKRYAEKQTKEKLERLKNEAIKKD